MNRWYQDPRVARAEMAVFEAEHAERRGDRETARRLYREAATGFATVGFTVPLDHPNTRSDLIFAAAVRRSRGGHNVMDPIKTGAAIGALGGLLLKGLTGVLVGGAVGAGLGWGLALFALPRPQRSRDARGHSAFLRPATAAECRPTTPKPIGGEPDPAGWPVAQPADFSAERRTARAQGIAAGRIAGRVDARVDAGRPDACYRPQVAPSSLVPFRYLASREDFIDAFAATYRKVYDETRRAQ